MRVSSQCMLALVLSGPAAEAKRMRGLRDTELDADVDPWQQELKESDVRILEESWSMHTETSEVSATARQADAEYYEDAPGDPSFPEKPATCPHGMLEPAVPGIMAGIENGRPNIVLAAGAGEPPFAELGLPRDGFPLAGFVVDFGLALMTVCDIDIVFSQAPSNTCFTSFGIGDRLVEGSVHGCANYLKTPGMRDRQGDFTLPIAENRIPSALLTRLDADGNPAVGGMDSLAGKIIVDVPGTVPNPDEFRQAINTCTGEAFAPTSMVTSSLPGNSDDAALKFLLEGKADALWINARTPDSLMCKNVSENITPTYDCKLWDGLGTTYAFVQTGIPSTALSGTTLAMSKKGSGLSKILDPCIEKLLKTEEYYNVCEKNGLAEKRICFPNEFFPPSTAALEIPEWTLPTKNITREDCSTGYCPCSAMASESTPTAPTPAVTPTIPEGPTLPPSEAEPGTETAMPTAGTAGNTTMLTMPPVTELPQVPSGVLTPVPTDDEDVDSDESDRDVLIDSDGDEVDADVEEISTEEPTPAPPTDTDADFFDADLDVDEDDIEDPTDLDADFFDPDADVDEDGIEGPTDLDADFFDPDADEDQDEAEEENGDSDECPLVQQVACFFNPQYCCTP